MARSPARRVFLLRVSSKVDGKKHAARKPDPKCNGCRFWPGAAADVWGNCSMFGRRHIAVGGWCLA